jgi:hypothetical protein
MTEPKLEPEQLLAMRGMLVAAVESDAKPRHVARRVGVAALALGAIAAVVTAVAVLPPSAGPADPSTAASSMLRTAAKAANDPAVADGQFLKLATTAAYLATTSLDGRPESTIGYLDARMRETFIPADDSTRPIELTTYVEPTVFFGAGAEEFAARDRKRTAEDSTNTPRVVVAEPDATRPVEDLSLMPRDPQALLDYLVDFRYQAGSSDENVFAHVVDLLRSGTVKSDLRAALYEALALMPSVVITEQQTTLDDRRGTAIGLATADGASRQEIIIDPATGEYIGVRIVSVNGFGEIPAGTTLEYTALTASVVDRVAR